MKKSQRLRLTALLGKGTNVTAAEQMEIAWLNALASANPDASKDEDDSPSGFRVALMDAVSGRKALGAELATAKARITELEAAAAPVTAVITTSLPEGALAAEDVTKLLADLKAAEEKLSAYSLQLTAFTSVLGLKADTLAGKSETDIRAAVDTRLGALAGEKIAELGFPESRLPASTQQGGSGAGDTLADIQAQLATERDPVKAGQLAAKANALRDKAWGKSGNN